MIIFEYIRWKNFLSTGDNWTEIQLNRSPTTLILGNNGSGKSSILDSLCFGLFGKPFRKINKPQLINTINQKGLLVEIEFTIGKIKYKIVRGLKPNIFEIYINGKIVDQTASNRDYQKYLEDFILKLNYNSFTQIVILGSSTFIPFMQLPAAQRREIIEDLLDIKIFTAMNFLLKEKLQTNKETLSSIKYKIELEEEKLKVHENYINEIKNSKEKRINEIKKEIEKTESSISRLNMNIENSNQKLQNLYKLIVNEKAIEKKVNEIKLIESKLEDKQRVFLRDIDFYKENNNCPTCKQDISQELKDTHISCKQKKLDELGFAQTELSTQLSSLLEQLSSFTKIHKEIASISESLNLDLSQVSSLQLYIKKIQNEILKDQKNDSLLLENEKINEIYSSIEKYNRNKKKLVDEKAILDIAADLLKDKGIKTQIVKQYIPIMNKLVNKYLASMEFFVSFELDENFNESIKSRHRDDFSYSSFSEGEKMRIDIALLLTWRAIAKMKNSTNTNLLILDEIFDASLDTYGCDDFMKLIDEISKDTNIFIISHKGEVLQDKFRSVIKFEKHKNFSRMVK